MVKAAEKIEESLQTKNVNDVYTDVFDAPQEQEESPVLKAQRYLNIFRQIHIFNSEKRKEFDNSLLLIDNRTKDALTSIPGGKILLDHLHELQERNGLSDDTMPFISSDAVSGGEEQISSTPINQAQAVTAVAAGGPITLSSTFAKDLAQSLATALKANNVIAQNNQSINELPTILNRSLGSYAANLQKMTEEFFSKHLQHFDDMQTRWLSQVHEQINLQNDYQNKLLSQQTEQIKLSNKQQSQQFQQLQQLQSQNLQQFEKIQSQNLQHFEQLQTHSVSTPVPGAGQLNTQTNNANSTTINNVNIDSQSLRLNDITNAIIETFKETNKQQITTLKELGESLSKSIIQSQRELSETILKSRPQIHIEQSSRESEKSKPVKEDIVIPEPKVIPEQNVIFEPDIDIEEIQPIDLNELVDKPVDAVKDVPINVSYTDKKKNADKSVKNKKDSQPSDSENVASKPQIKEKNDSINKEAPKANQPKQDVKPEKEKEKNKNKNSSNKLVDNLLDDVEEVDITAAFPSLNDKQTGKNFVITTPKPEPKKENKETSAPLKEAFTTPKPEPKKENKETSAPLKEAFTTPKPEPKKEAKETSAPLKEAFTTPKPESKKEAKDDGKNNKNNSLHLYDDAMQRIKDALNNEEPVLLNDLETPVVSLDKQNSAFDTSTDDDLWNSFAPTSQETLDKSEAKRS